MIPKIIHYCWFGNEKMPAEQDKCIEEWKHLHPDWEFVLWNEMNSPTELPYLQNALANKKWANLSNFVRLFALKTYGGIYMDTDFKVIRDLTPLLENDCFFGFEEYNAATKIFWLNNAICGSLPHHDFINTCLDELLTLYDGNEESNLSSPKLVTDLLIREKGVTEYRDQVVDGIRLYATEYFYPIHYSEAYKLGEFEKHLLPETMAVHLWARSWIDKSVLIETIDHLTRKANNQDRYIAELKELTAKLEAKADEIYYWKQHFEGEFNKLNEKQDQFINLHRQLDKMYDQLATTQSGVQEVQSAVNNLVSIIKRTEGIEEPVDNIEQEPGQPPLQDEVTNTAGTGHTDLNPI